MLIDIIAGARPAKRLNQQCNLENPPMAKSATPRPASDYVPPKSPPVPKPQAKTPASEIGGRDGLDPTRYGDWERKGIAVDF